VTEQKLVDPFTSLVAELGLSLVFSFMAVWDTTALAVTATGAEKFKLYIDTLLKYCKSR
jgi:hypothetical protein